MALKDLTNNTFSGFSNPTRKRRLSLKPTLIPHRIKRRKNQFEDIKMASAVHSVKNDSKIEMDQLLSWKNEKRSQLEELKSKIWKLRTKIPEVELGNEKLSNEYLSLKKDYQLKEKEMTELDGINKIEALKIEAEFENFKNDLEEQFNREVTELSEAHDKKLLELYYEREDEFKKKEGKLLDDITQLQSKLEKTNETTLEIKVSEINKKHSKIIEENQEKFTEEILGLEFKKTELLFELKELQDNEPIETSGRNQIQLETENINIRLNSAKEEYDKLIECGRLAQTQLQFLQAEYQHEQLAFESLKSQVTSYDIESDTIKANTFKEEKIRRTWHNQLQGLIGNIRVFCRLKPQPNDSFEYKQYSMLETSDTKEQIILTEPLSSCNTIKRHKKYTFSFDKIFDQQSSNSEIFEEISQLVQSSLDGFNVCIFAYGQTGSGKTFTMCSPNDGIIPRSLVQIFERIQTLRKVGWEYHLQGNFFEIYGDVVRDLLTSKSSINNEVSTIDLIGFEQVEKLLTKASRKRKTATTMANDQSSRSHSIFRISIIGKHESNGDTIIGKLNLIDLAGSERISHSQVSGIRLKETQAINKSLSALGDVISSLKNGESHIPYRNSKLTYLLKDSLGGDSKTLMFVNISCQSNHFNESLNSLRFASKVNDTRLG